MESSTQAGFSKKENLPTDVTWQSKGRPECRHSLAQRFRIPFVSCFSLVYPAPHVSAVIDTIFMRQPPEGEGLPKGSCGRERNLISQKALQLSAGVSLAQIGSVLIGDEQINLCG